MSRHRGAGGISRRGLLAVGAVAGSAAAGAAEIFPPHDGTLGAPGQDVRDTLPWREGQADAPSAAETATARFFTAAEAAFVTAAADRLIPPDPTGPSASEAGVPTFIDRQLAGPYGQGDHFYLGGPWRDGTDSQGYQSRLTPAQFYRRAISEIENHVGRIHGGKAFKDLGPDDQDGLLKQMESGDLHLDGPVDSKAFFSLFLQNVKEGYFSDPIYGGNRNGSAWAMIGFPGAHYDYSPWVTAYNQSVPVKPVGLRGRPGWSRS